MAASSRRTARITRLRELVEQGDPAAVLEGDDLWEELNDVGDTCLHLAVRLGHLDLVSAIMKHATDHMPRENKAKETPFSIVVDAVADDGKPTITQCVLMEMVANSEPRFLPSSAVIAAVRRGNISLLEHVLSLKSGLERVNAIAVHALEHDERTTVLMLKLLARESSHTAHWAPVISAAAQKDYRLVLDFLRPFRVLQITVRQMVEYDVEYALTCFESPSEFLIACASLGLKQVFEHPLVDSIAQSRGAELTAGLLFSVVVQSENADLLNTLIHKGFCYGPCGEVLQVLARRGSSLDRLPIAASLVRRSVISPPPSTVVWWNAVKGGTVLIGGFDHDIPTAPQSLELRFVTWDGNEGIAVYRVFHLAEFEGGAGLRGTSKSTTSDGKVFVRRCCDGSMNICIGLYSSTPRICTLKPSPHNRRQLGGWVHLPIFDNLGHTAGRSRGTAPERPSFASRDSLFLTLSVPLFREASIDMVAPRLASTDTQFSEVDHFGSVSSVTPGQEEIVFSLEYDALRAAIHSAARIHDAEMVGVLLDAAHYGPDVTWKGRTPLMAALCSPPGCVNAATDTTPADIAAHRVKCEKYERTLDMLVERGADVMLLSDAGVPVIGYAAIAGNDKVVRLCLERGADATFYGTRSSPLWTTPIIAATKMQHAPVLRLLCESAGQYLFHPHEHPMEVLANAGPAKNDVDVEVVDLLLKHCVVWNTPPSCPIAVPARVEQLPSNISAEDVAEARSKISVSLMKVAGQSGRLDVLQKYVELVSAEENFSELLSVALASAGQRVFFPSIRYLIAKGATLNSRQLHALPVVSAGVVIALMDDDTVLSAGVTKGSTLWEERASRRKIVSSTESAALYVACDMICNPTFPLRARADGDDVDPVLLLFIETMKCLPPEIRLEVCSLFQYPILGDRLTEQRLKGIGSMYEIVYTEESLARHWSMCARALAVHVAGYGEHSSGSKGKGEEVDSEFLHALRDVIEAALLRMAAVPPLEGKQLFITRSARGALRDRLCSTTAGKTHSAAVSAASDCLSDPQLAVVAWSGVPHQEPKRGKAGKKSRRITWMMSAA